MFLLTEHQYPSTVTDLIDIFLLSRDDENIERMAPQRDIVLLFGLCDAGKSTLAQLLIDDDRYLTAVQTSPGSGEYYINNTINVRSQTIFGSRGTVYYDCPGFNDTQSLAHDVTETHFIRRVIGYAERLKFVLVVSQDFMENGSMFIDLIVATFSHIRNINVFREGIALIVTKVKNTYETVGEDEKPIRVSDENEIKAIAENLMKLKEGIAWTKRNVFSEERLKQYELATQFIDILLQKNGDRYIKIGILRSPSKAGPLNADEQIQKNKLHIRNLFANHLTFIVKNVGDFTKYTLLFYSFYGPQGDVLSDVFKLTDVMNRHVWESNYGEKYILLTKIQQLNVTLHIQHSRMIGIALMLRNNVPVLRVLIEPFYSAETLRWYDTLVTFNRLLANYEFQSDLDSDAMRKQYEELSVGITNKRKSLLNDIWKNNMQPATTTWNSETKTLRIHGFLLRLSEVTAIIRSTDGKKAQTYELFAIDTIFFDDDLQLTNDKSLIIIAPVLIVIGNRLISLERQACQAAGHFWGLWFEFRNSPQMVIRNTVMPVNEKAITMNNYKRILRASLTGPDMRKNPDRIMNIYARIDKNYQEIVKFHDENDFVAELIVLETEYQQFNEHLYIYFFESLLRQVKNYPADDSTNATLNFLSAAIFTRIHNIRNEFDSYLVINMNEYLRVIAESMNFDIKIVAKNIKQSHFALATKTYKKTISDRIDEAQTFITTLRHHVGTRLEEMNANIISTQLELEKLKQQAQEKEEETSRKSEKLESELSNLRRGRAALTIASAAFGMIPFVGPVLAGAGQVGVDQINDDIGTVQTKIAKNEIERDKNLKLLEETVKNQEKFDSKLTPLLEKLENEILRNKLNYSSKSQIGLEVSRYGLMQVFKEFVHYLKQITVDSIEEVRLSIGQLEDAMQMMLDIYDRVQTYNQKSEMVDYLNALASGPATPNQRNQANPVLTQLENFITTNLICTQYKKAINEITLFAFPFGDTYLATLQPRNLCEGTKFNVSSLEMLAAAHTQITHLSLQISTSDTTVNAQRDNHLVDATFNRDAGIGPFQRWSNAEHRNSIRKLLAGNEVIFSSEIQKTNIRRMAVKFREIGIAIRTHVAADQLQLDTVLDGYEMRMKHMGLSYYRWHDEFYMIVSDASIELIKSFGKCNATHACHANAAYNKLLNGNAVLSPYTLWTMQLRPISSAWKSYDRLQRFADQVDIDLEGTGTYVDERIKLDRNLIDKYYQKYNVNY